MFERQTTGSVVCPSCGKLVGVNDETCWNCGRRNPGLWGYAHLVRSLGDDLGFVQVVMWSCIALYVVSLLMEPGAIGLGGNLLGMLSPSTRSVLILGASGSLPVFDLGRWWTPLSAGWLHGSLLHILFNMLWVRQLAPATAHLYGAGRLMILYVVASVSGFLASTLAARFLFFMPDFLRGGQLTLGASAAIFGLLGAMVYYGRRTGQRAVGSSALTYAVFLFVFGLLVQGVDNWAHLGGYVGGYVMARRLDPMRPERVDHIIAGLALVAVSAVAILLSVLHAFFG